MEYEDRRGIGPQKEQKEKKMDHSKNKKQIAIEEYKTIEIGRKEKIIRTVKKTKKKYYIY